MNSFSLSIATCGCYARLSRILENQCYIDEGMIASAIRSGSSFNLIHLQSIIKIDVFLHKEDPYAEIALHRKRKYTFEEHTNVELYFSSPEDIIIAKIRWYKIGGFVSNRQWTGIRGVIKVQGDLLDKNYLKNWSRKLGLSSLMQNAFDDAGVEF